MPVIDYLPLAMTSPRLPLIALLCAALCLPFAPAEAAQAKTPKVFFIGLKNGVKVRSPVTVQMGVAGMELAPAGVLTPNSGHFHLLINTLPLKGKFLKRPIPDDERHRHFNDAQRETQLNLPPGLHSLQIVFADGNHVPHDPPVMSDRITLEVVK